jgi:hypothetical protein
MAQIIVIEVMIICCGCCMKLDRLVVEHHDRFSPASRLTSIFVLRARRQFNFLVYSSVRMKN